MTLVVCRGVRMHSACKFAHKANQILCQATMTLHSSNVLIWLLQPSSSLFAHEHQPPLATAWFIDYLQFRNFKAVVYKINMATSTGELTKFIAPEFGGARRSYTGAFTQSYSWSSVFSAYTLSFEAICCSTLFVFIHCVYRYLPSYNDVSCFGFVGYFQSFSPVNCILRTTSISSMTTMLKLIYHKIAKFANRCGIVNMLKCRYKIETCRAQTFSGFR